MNTFYQNAPVKRRSASRSRVKLYFFSTTKYSYSPFNKRQILWIHMSSTALDFFSIVRQNGNELFNFFLQDKSFTERARVNELKVFINSGYIQNYIIYDIFVTLQIPENFLYTGTPCSLKQHCNIAQINNMIYSLIFCVNVGVVLAAEEDSRSAYIKTLENKRLHGYVVKKIDSTDEMLCSQACLRHFWCTASNFKESLGNCELTSMSSLQVTPKSLIIQAQRFQCFLR